MAGITISVYAGKDQASSTVQASGSVQHLITDDERTAFNIQDAALKAAVGQYFGQNPDDAFLTDPTPWNNLYATYGWPQVQTTMTVVSAQITGLTSEPQILAQNTFTNSSNKPGTFSAGATSSVSETVESSWSETHGLEASQSVSYGISFLGSGGSGETSLSYSASFGTGGSNSTQVTVGSEQGISVELQPGESVVAVLSASRGTLTVDVTYQVSLQGSTAINYGDTYKGHHFWGLDLNGVLQAAKQPASYTITETLTIGYFTNASIVLQNPTAKAALAQAAIASVA